MKKHILIVLFVSIIFVMPAKADWLDSMVSNVVSRVNSATNSTPAPSVQRTQESAVRFALTGNDADFQAFRTNAEHSFGANIEVRTNGSSPSSVHSSSQPVNSVSNIEVPNAGIEVTRATERQNADLQRTANVFLPKAATVIVDQYEQQLLGTIEAERQLARGSVSAGSYHFSSPILGLLFGRGANERANEAEEKLAQYRAERERLTREKEQVPQRIKEMRVLVETQYLTEEKIRRIQDSLKRLGQDPGSDYGRMTEQTRKAIIAFRDENGLNYEEDLMSQLARVTGTAAEEIVITVDRANLRSGPGMENPIVAQGFRDARYLLLEISGEWFGVQLIDGSTAWIAKSLSRREAVVTSDILGTRLTQSPAAANATAGTVWTNALGMKFVYCPPGEFMMGSPDNELGAIPLIEPQHRVRLTRGFWLAQYEVNQKEWQAVMGTNPSAFRGYNLPVEHVSWDDAQSFCQKLSERTGETYRLPTEAEWEYACRAGSTTRFSFGNSDNDLGSYAWYGNNSGEQTHPVGQKRANSWGLYDMHGNEDEWCADRYGDYPSVTVTNPSGPASGPYRVIRGGSWRNDSPMALRSANREFDLAIAPSAGFRSVFTTGASSNLSSPQSESANEMSNDASTHTAAPGITIRVKIINATGRNGLAAEVERKLEAADPAIRTVSIGSASFATDATVIYDKHNRMDLTRRVQQIIGVGRIAENVEMFREYDVLVVIGTDYPGN